MDDDPQMQAAVGREDRRTGSANVTKMLNPSISRNVSSLFRVRYYLSLMLSPMPLYILLACSVYAVCLLKMLVAAIHAPIGYEDPKGFHYGMETLKPDGDL